MANNIVIRMAGENSALRRSLDSSAKEVSKLERQLARAKKNSGGTFDGVKKSALGSIGPLAGLGAAFGSLGGITKLATDSVASFEDLAKSTSKLQAITKMDTVTSAGWIRLANEKKIGAKQLNQSFITLSKAMDSANNGGKKSADVFRELGVSQAMLKSGNANAVLMQVSNAFQKMGPGAHRAALAQQLFSRGGQALIGVLSKGKGKLSEQIAELGKASGMNDKSKKSAMDLVVQQQALNASVDSLKLNLGSALIPVFSKVTTFAGKFADQIRTGTGAGGTFKKAVVSIWNAAKGLAKDLGPLIKGIADFASKHPEVVKFALAFAAVAVVGLKVAKAIGVIGTALEVFEAILAPLEIELLPIIAVILIVAGLAYLIYRNWKPISKFFEGLWKGIKVVAVAVWNGLKAFFIGAWNGIKSLFHSAGAFISKAAKYGFLGPIPFIISHWKGIWNFLKGLFNSITGFLGSAVGTIAGAAKRLGLGLWHGFTGAISGIGGFVKGIFNAIPGTIKSVVNSVLHHVNGLIDNVNNVSGKIGITLPHVPYLATGGIVNGGRLAMIGEDGPEAVIPLSPKYRARGASLYAAAGAAMGMGGHTFVVNNNGSDIDPNTLAAKWAWQMQTRGAV